MAGRFWVRAFAFVAVAGCCGSSPSAASPRALQPATVLARSIAALQRSGMVVEVTETIHGFGTRTIYINADGRLTLHEPQGTRRSSLDGCCELPYFFVLSHMTDFRAVDGSIGGAAVVVVTGRYHLSDSSGCHTRETVVLDGEYLPMQWRTRSCDGSQVAIYESRTRAMDPLTVPSDLFA